MYSVETASDGRSGAFLGRTGSYDLIILNHNLPKLNGPAVPSEIRREKHIFRF